MTPLRIFPVILAGGASSRLWPASGKEKPKWDLRLFGTKDSCGKPQSLLESAWERARALASAADCFVVGSATSMALVRTSLPELLEENLLIEPEPRDTAAAVAFATGVILKRTKKVSGGVMLVLSGDQVIRPISQFVRCAQIGAQAAVELNALITFGIVPKKPMTQYGYIQRGPMITLSTTFAPDSPKLYRLLQFREKPDRTTAEQYFKAGEYFWNGGIFLWTLDSVLKEFDRQLPAHATLARAISDAPTIDPVLQQYFLSLKKTSIDFGIMEHAQNAAMVAADFEWDDIGSWSAIGEHLDRQLDNVVGPDTKLITVDARGNLIFAPGKRVSLIGVEGLAIIESDNEILVCRLERDQDVKKASEEATRSLRE
ncbi:MAG: sugar phosphate nucleotidyltransferase [Planctomycetota bacterium]